MCAHALSRAPLTVDSLGEHRGLPHDEGDTDKPSEANSSSHMPLPGAFPGPRPRLPEGRPRPCMGYLARLADAVAPFT